MQHNYEQFVNTQNFVEFLKKLMDTDVSPYFPVIYKMMINMGDTNDYTTMLNILKNIYETGFNRSIKAHQKTLEQMGLKSNPKN